jgi:DNA ligase D-like protein (predicted 3'-phosphoesterase)
VRFQASFLPETDPVIYTHIFGPVRAYDKRGRTVYVTRAFESLEQLKTLCGTFQSRMERANKSFSGAVIQPEGQVPPVEPAAFQIFTPLKVKLDYGDPSPRTAAQPLEHPDTVVIPPNEFYPQGLTEQRVADYYDGVKANLISQYEQYDLDGMVKMAVDGQTIMKRHARMGEDELDVQGMRIQTSEEFDQLNRGRTVEFHFAVGAKTRMAWVDLDPKPEFPFDDVKEVAHGLVVDLGRAFGSTQMAVRFSGRSGFHVVALLPEERDTDEVREVVASTVEAYLAKTKDDRLTAGVTRDPGRMRLDYSTLHAAGGLRMPWSLAHPTGLICLPLAPDQVRMFRKEDATIDQIANPLAPRSSGITDPVVLAAIDTMQSLFDMFMGWMVSRQLPDDPTDLDWLETQVSKDPEGTASKVAVALKQHLGDPQRVGVDPQDMSRDIELGSKITQNGVRVMIAEMLSERRQASIRRQAAAFDADLETYRHKRQFDQTPEPEDGAREAGGIYGVQIHHSSGRAGLHRDIRIEKDGVLMSFVTKQDIPTSPGSSIYVTEVEDHPIAYLTEMPESFDIPAGQYGAGSVRLETSGQQHMLEQSNEKFKVRFVDGLYSGTYTFICMGNSNIWKMVRGRD